MTIFWDLDNLRPPNGLETVWAFRMVEAAFEFADVAHVRAYARAGTVGDDARTVLDAVGVTLVECPAVPEGSDAVLSTDVVNFVAEAVASPRTTRGRISSRTKPRAPSGNRGRTGS